MYKHYKGGVYEVLHLAKHTETEELMVIYRSLTDYKSPEVWARPLGMFTESIETDNMKMLRFEQMYDE